MGFNQILVSTKARVDLTEWIDRIAFNDQAAAVRFFEKIERDLQLLASHPELGHKHPKRLNIRKLVEPPLIIYYEVGTDYIEVLRFWHAARNPRSIRYR